MTDLPDIASLVPHAQPMILVDELVASSDNKLVCRLTVRSDGLFDNDGQVPAYLGIEYMAQSIAAYSGLECWRQQVPVRVGLLLGTRRFNSSVSQFQVGAILTVSVEQLIQGSDGMAAFACRVEGDGVVQSATLAVYEPADTTSLFLETGAKE